MGIAPLYLISMREIIFNPSEKFALRQCVNNKYRKPKLIPRVKGHHKEALAEAL